MSSRTSGGVLMSNIHQMGIVATSTSITHIGIPKYTSRVPATCTPETKLTQNLLRAERGVIADVATAAR